ncbi:MAG TPA: Ig-like domain-containing protein, partial [Candidatus Nitrosotalea sp.]|nr:Ig-like domain-containing protein [Candidatus Nitrosotalea sp.]
TVDISAKGYVISTIPASTTVTTSITGSAGTTAPGASTTASGTSTTTTTASPNGTSTTTSTTITNTATSGTGSGTSVPASSSSTSAPSSSSATATGTITETSTELSVCAKNPIPISTSQVKIYAIAQSFFMDDKTPCFYSLPILTTGNKELVGVLALKDSSGFPALAKSGLSFQIDSSDISTVSVPNVEMGYGDQSALVFAQVGNTANPITLNVVSGSPQQIVPVIASPSKTSSGLVADPLLTTVLPNTQFPLAIYTTNNGALSSFKNDFTALISPQESISPVQLTVTNGEPIFLSDETLLKTGSQNIAITTPDYSTVFTVSGASSKSNGMTLSYPDQISSNKASLFSIELLDDKQLPILADKDINLQLVSSNSSVLYVPDNVQIKKGSYYATFDAISKGSGTAEIAVLADGLPLSKFDIPITSFTPVVNLDSIDHVDNNSPLTATATAIYNSLPVSGLNVDWTVSGATIKNKDSMTDKDGKATISVITSNPSTVEIQASVGGGPYQTVTASKQISVNPPLLSATTVQSSQDNSQSNSFTVMGISPIIFVIPGAAAAAFVILKKKNMLEGISERINIAEKFSEMMGRVSTSQER